MTHIDDDARERVRQLEALLERADAFIHDLGQDLHSQRVADWYPEGAHNAAETMSEAMRNLGNACADFCVSTAPAPSAALSDRPVTEGEG